MACLEEDLGAVYVADAGDHGLVHQDAADGLLADLDLLPQRLRVRVLPQRVVSQPQLRRLVELCTAANAHEALNGASQYAKALVMFAQQRGPAMRNVVLSVHNACVRRVPAAAQLMQVKLRTADMF